MNKEPQKPVGWFDWHVIVAMILFALLMICSIYANIKFLKYFAFIPAIYGIIRTFARIYE